MPVVVVANPKGGVGKSTLSTNVAGYYASRGHSVVLGDIDPQKSGHLWLSLRPANVAAIGRWDTDADALAKPSKLALRSRQRRKHLCGCRKHAWQPWLKSSNHWPSALFTVGPAAARMTSTYPSMTAKHHPRPLAHAFPLHPVALASLIAVLAMPQAALAQSSPSATAPVLQEVTVKSAPETPDALPAAAPGGKVARGARLGVLGNVGVMDTPFNQTAYTAEGIADQQAQTVAAVLKGDPSVRMTTNDGHVVENFNIRGFAVGASSLAINGMYGLAPEQNTPTEMFERVEVLKGPGAMMMGINTTGDVGGAINLVPKRAGKEALTRITTTWSNKSNVGVHADVSRLGSLIR
eukprot:gene34100-42048_t